MVATPATRRRPPSLPRRVLINRGLPWLYVRTLVAGRRQRRLFDEVETYCMFIGYPRSGHSLVGSLLDAHPEAVIAHELDVLRYLLGGFRRDQLFAMILENDRQFTAGGRRAKTGNYEYLVPNQWQGRHRRLRVIGDKRGGRSTTRLEDRPQLIDRVQRVVGVPMRVVHVVRNPFDNISTMHKRRGGKASLDEVVDAYLAAARVNAAMRVKLGPQQVIDVRHEDLLAEPGAVLQRLCDFLGLETDEAYLRDCAGILYTSPHQTRHDAPWTPDLRARVEAAIAELDFLTGYAFDD